MRRRRSLDPQLAPDLEPQDPGIVRGDPERWDTTTFGSYKIIVLSQRAFIASIGSSVMSIAGAEANRIIQ